MDDAKVPSEPQAPPLPTVLSARPAGFLPSDGSGEIAGDDVSARNCPLFVEGVAAGFPSPARDDVEAMLNLHDLCVPRPAATYFVRAAGDSMINAGIHDGDILVVDRSLEARTGDVVVAARDGAFTVKRLERGPAGVRLLPENPLYQPIVFRDGEECELFGVVSSVVHFFRPHR